jgi:ubiquinone/menaquinone biosynthesis C-methylase UbiE
MPVMPMGERLFCRTPPWRALSRRLVPWALSGASLDGEVLEIGGGSGAMAEGILRTAPGARVTIVDIDPVMVRMIEQSLSDFGSRVRAVVGDATALPFEDDSFDAVVSFLMLHHVGAWERAVAEALRVLRPGGRFVGYDLVDSVRTRAIHHLDNIHDLRSVRPETFATAARTAGARDVQLRPGRTGLTLRWIVQA